jgi:hypothetical protein
MKKIAKITTTINNILAIVEEIANRNRAECGYAFVNEWQSDCNLLAERGYELPDAPENYMLRLLDHDKKFLVQNWTDNSDFGYALEVVWGGELPKDLKYTENSEVAVSHFVWDDISHFKNARFIEILDIYEEIKICGHRARRERGYLYMITQNGPKFIREMPERVFLLPDPYFNKTGFDCERDSRARKELADGPRQQRRAKLQQRRIKLFADYIARRQR